MMSSQGDESGYWRISKNSTEWILCPYGAEACTSELQRYYGNQLCSNNFENYLCSQPAAGYYIDYFSRDASSCSAHGSNATTLSVAAIIFPAIIFISLSLYTCLSFKRKAKILNQLSTLASATEDRIKNTLSTTTASLIQSDPAPKAESTGLLNYAWCSLFGISKPNEEASDRLTDQDEDNTYAPSKAKLHPDSKFAWLVKIKIVLSIMQVSLKMTIYLSSKL